MKIMVIDLIGNRCRKFIAASLVITLVFAAFVLRLVLLGMDSADSIFTGTNEAPLIIIDAGHGGEDPGAVGVNGALEKDLNLDIALEIGRTLEERGCVVVYTRTDDRMLYRAEENIKGIRKISDLKNRVEIAKRYPDAILVSIHMNSFGSAKYSGLQVYYGEKDKASESLADMIQQKVKTDLQPDNNRKIKKADGMYLLENVDNTAVLIECGFLTNAEECKKLSEKEYQKQLSFSIVCGIIEYIEEKK